MKLLISGSRNFQNFEALCATIDEMIVTLQLQETWDCTPTEILHGGAKGADQMAGKYARKYNIKETVILPDYQKYDGKIAPIIRNTDLVKKADFVIAFYGQGRDEKGGTKDTAEKAKKQRKHLIERYSDGTTKYTEPLPEQGSLF